MTPAKIGIFRGYTLARSIDGLNRDDMIQLSMIRITIGTQGYWDFHRTRPPANIDFASSRGWQCSGFVSVEGRGWWLGHFAGKKCLLKLKCSCCDTSV